MNQESTLNARPETIRPPSRALFLTELPRALSEVAALPSFSPWLRAAPRGDGHAVLVLPGFTASDSSTRTLRRFLKRSGYQPFGWQLGRNLGPSQDLLEKMMARLQDLAREHGSKLSLVGQSLGGIYARELARRAPDLVRRVVTLGSPFAARPGTASNIQSLYDEVTGDRPNGIDPELIARLGVAPPVPTIAIYSRGDGIVHWKSTVQRRGEQAENIEVTGSHTGMGFNPLVLYALADRLAQPDDGWSPFRRRGAKRVFYPRPVPCNAIEPEPQPPENDSEQLGELADDLVETAQSAVEASATAARKVVGELSHEVAEVTASIAPNARRAVELGVEQADRGLREIGILDFLGFELLNEASAALAEGATDLRLSALDRATGAARHYVEGLRAFTEAKSLGHTVRARHQARRKLVQHQIEGVQEARQIVRRTARQVAEPLVELMLPFGRLVRREWTPQRTTKRP